MKLTEQQKDTSYLLRLTRKLQKNYWSGGMNRSFVLVCQELGIPNIEYHNIARKQVRGTSVQEWADFDVLQFTEHQKLLSQFEKETLTSYLKECMEALRL